jgi:hypothetical protein
MMEDPSFRWGSTACAAAQQQEGQQHTPCGSETLLWPMRILPKLACDLS